MFRHSYIDQAGKLLCDVAEYVKRHNVVHKTPPVKVQDGLPLGNGFMGGLVYQTDRELCMRINRPDCFDYGPRENFGAWGLEWEEKWTTLANCGVIKISDGTPAFAWEYLNDYDMTLDLSRAEINMKSDTPFAKYAAKGWGSLEYGCVVWEVAAQNEEPVERTIDLERYGTRAFFHYYESFSRDTKRRLYGVTAGERDGCMYITQELRGLTFTTAACVLGEGAKYVFPNKRTARCVLPVSEKAEFKVYITTAISRTGGDTVAEAVEVLKKAVAAGDKARESSLKWWREYWNRSFVNMGNELAENAYYMFRYQFGCSGLATFPPSIFAGIWNAMGDVRCWGHYYHWNDQQQYWPVDAWNHPELYRNYFDYRRGMLDNAKKDCLDVHGAEGAWYSDIAEAGGYQAIEPDTKGNMTCGPLISIQMYRHYRHYLNKDFLINTAWPVMKACADMYLNLFVKEEDGRYHIHDVTALEGYLYINDTLTDWTMSRALFTALLDVADEVGAPDELRARWQDALDNLYEPVTTMIDGVEVLAYGRHADGAVCYDTAYPESGMGTGDAGGRMPVFPASMYGKWTADDPYYELVKNTMEEMTHRGVAGPYGALIAYARFGWADQVGKNLTKFVVDTHPFANGMGGPTYSNKGRLTYRVQPIPEGCKYTDWNNIHEKDKKERITYDGERFGYFISEYGGDLCAVVNESLLQSWEGKIRVFPANGDEEALFRLHAEGDFMVTSQKDKGIIRFVAVESGAGARLNVVSPFEKMECVRVDGKEVPFELTEKNGERIISLDTEKGKTYVIFSKACHIDGSYPTCFPTDVVNRNAKKFGTCNFGLERDF